MGKVTRKTRLKEWQGKITTKMGGKCEKREKLGANIRAKSDAGRLLEKRNNVKAFRGPSGPSEKAGKPAVQL